MERQEGQQRCFLLLLYVLASAKHKREPRGQSENVGNVPAEVLELSSHSQLLLKSGPACIWTVACQAIKAKRVRSFVVVSSISSALVLCFFGGFCCKLRLSEFHSTAVEILTRGPTLHRYLAVTFSTQHRKR